jgi:hypothetical protein
MKNASRRLPGVYRDVECQVLIHQGGDNERSVPVNTIDRRNALKGILGSATAIGVGVGLGAGLGTAVLSPTPAEAVPAALDKNLGAKAGDLDQLVEQVQYWRRRRRRYWRRRARRCFWRRGRRVCVW